MLQAIRRCAVVQACMQRAAGQVLCAQLPMLGASDVCFGSRVLPFCWGPGWGGWIARQHRLLQIAVRLEGCV